ncbi:MAG TPA: hypothetical protein VG297_19810, partial [Bryobacteraceae bacterium]|nr:hypothetical protein [Bryobacteraceae bacterium]
MIAAVAQAQSPPLITSFTPNSANAGAASASATVGGQNFVAGSTLEWTAPNGFQTSITPSLIQAAQIAATVPAALLTTAGTAQVAVQGPSGVMSNAAGFTITTTSGSWISSVSPSFALAGSPQISLTFNGRYAGAPLQPAARPTRMTARDEGSVITDSGGGYPIAIASATWTQNGVVQLLPLSRVNDSVTLTVSSDLLHTPGVAYISLGDSNQVPFEIRTATGIVNPQSTAYGSPDTPISITGASLFGQGSVVQWTRPDGKVVAINPSLINGAQIAATVPAAFLTTPGTAQIAIADPSGIISSPSLPFTISSPLFITSLTPNTGTAGDSASGITAASTAPLTTGTTVKWMGPDGVVTNLGGLINAAQIAATVPASLLTTAGTAQVGLVDGSGVLSNQLPFAIRPFNISTVTPNAVTAHSTSTQIRITGNNLAGAANLVWTSPDGHTNQSALDLVQAAQVAATIPAAFLTTAGTAQVALADAFGNPSNPLNFSVAALDPLTITTTAIPSV